MKKFIVLAIALTVGAGYFFLMRDFHHQDEAIYFNGTILTMDDAMPSVEAVFVKKGIIVAAGTSEKIMKLKSASTAMVNLDGKTMLPGLIDPHTHVDLSAFLFTMVDLSGFTHASNEDVWRFLEASVKKFPKGEWIVCKGLDPILTRDLKTPHLSYLDKIAPDNPLVIISQTMHSYWINTNAFRAAGITAQTPNPSAASIYEKDGQGNLTGFIAEQEAFEPVRKALLKATPVKNLIGTIDLTMRDYAKKGFTTVVSQGLFSKDKTILRLYGHLSAQKPEFISQVLAAVGLFPKRSPLPRHFMYIRDDMLNQLPGSPVNGDDYCKILGIKLWYDGSPYTGSMYMKQPYLDSELSRKELHIPSGHRGSPLIRKNELIRMITKFTAEKWQIAIHAQGDQANADVIEAFSEANKAVDITPYRHRLEHGLLLDREYLAAMKRLNLTPSFHINHIYYYGASLSDAIIGRERANLALPIKSAMTSGINFSLHADQPMFDSDPFSLIYTAVTRKTREGRVLGPGEGVTVGDALRAFTVMAAWHIGFEKKLGTISPGKYADFVILDRNPLATPIEKIRDIRVVTTIVGGNSISY